MRRILSASVLVPAVLTSLLGPSVCMAESQSSATTRPTVPACAVLADANGALRESPLVAMLEVKLAEGGRVRLVERTGIDKVLREQALQLAFAPEGGGRRREVRFRKGPITRPADSYGGGGFPSLCPSIALLVLTPSCWSPMRTIAWSAVLGAGRAGTTLMRHAGSVTTDRKRTVGALLTIG